MPQARARLNLNQGKVLRAARVFPTTAAPFQQTLQNSTCCFHAKATTPPINTPPTTLPINAPIIESACGSPPANHNEGHRCRAIGWHEDC